MTLRATNEERGPLLDTKFLLEFCSGLGLRRYEGEACTVAIVRCKGPVDWRNFLFRREQIDHLDASLGGKLFGIIARLQALSKVGNVLCDPFLDGTVSHFV